VVEGGSGDERVNMNSARLVVVANGGFYQDNLVAQDQQALVFVSGRAKVAVEPRATDWHCAKGFSLTATRAPNE
jgi:hypothetical protein